MSCWLDQSSARTGNKGRKSAQWVDEDADVMMMMRDVQSGKGQKTEFPQTKCEWGRRWWIELIYFHTMAPLYLLFVWFSVRDGLCGSRGRRKGTRRIYSECDSVMCVLFSLSMPAMQSRVRCWKRCSYRWPVKCNNCIMNMQRNGMWQIKSKYACI